VCHVQGSTWRTFAGEIEVSHQSVRLRSRRDARSRESIRHCSVAGRIADALKRVTSYASRRRSAEPPAQIEELPRNASCSSLGRWKVRCSAIAAPLAFMCLQSPHVRQVVSRPERLRALDRGRPRDDAGERRIPANAAARDGAERCVPNGGLAWAIDRQVQFGVRISSRPPTGDDLEGAGTRTSDHERPSGPSPA
jgi:hypothetical protein